MQTLEEFKEQEKRKLREKRQRGILEEENAEFLAGLIDRAKDTKEVLKLTALGTNYKHTGFCFDVRLEKDTRRLSYLRRREDLSFCGSGLTHRLIYRR